MSSVVKKVTGGIGDLVGSITGSDEAAGASKAAARTAAEAQSRALEYLKEREALPQEYREAALTQLGGLYGLGEDADQAASIEALRASPIYGAILGGREAGEEAIMRQAAATGGLRSGNVQEALYDYNTQLENQALLQSMQGLQGMAQLPSYAPQIAQGMAGIGQTQAQGIQAAGQAQQAGFGTLISGGLGALGSLWGAGGSLGLGNLASKAFGAVKSLFSDERLKTKVRKIGEINGHNIYTWEWNEAAKSIGLEGVGVGVLSKEVKEKNPDAIGEKNGYETVDYKKLGLD